MKFLFLSSHAHYALDPNADRVSGGAELQVALLAKELARRGNEVTIIGGDTGQEDRRVLDGVMTRTGGRFHTGKAMDAVCSLPRIAKLINEHRPQFVAILGWTAWLYILTWFQPIFGFKLIFICGLDTEIDGTFSKSHGWRGVLFERGIALSNFRFAMSEYQRRLFHQLGQKCGFYRNLILSRQEHQRTEKQIDLLWVGRCQKIKRPHLFLDLVERLPNARCEMICPNEDEVLWKEVTARAVKIPNLQFHERVPYFEIQHHYDQTHLLVSTSEAEGFPNVMIQAAQGRAGILSLDLDPDGLIEIFDAGFYARGDFENLVKKTSNLLADPSTSEKLGHGAERMLEQWFDNSRNTDAFLEGLQ